jgi:hypothetical protein
MNPHLTTAVLALVVVGSAAIPAVPTASRSTPTAAPPAAGMRAYIDPATGALLPEPAPGTWRRELQSPELIPDDSKLEVINNPDGSIGVMLHEQRQATVVAALAPDGSVRTECIESTAVPSKSPKIDQPDAHHD